MARNRIIHNVQDVFVGSTPDEADQLVTGIPNLQFLKRITRIQSFNYSIDLPQSDASTLGKSNAFSRDVLEPPTVNLSLVYYLNGVDNEKRMGLNTGGASKCITHDMITSKTKDARNIYLTVNDRDMDLHQATEFVDLDGGGSNWSENKIADAQATGYNVVAFQNCYLASYNLKVDPGSLPEVDVSYVADNITAYTSGSGVGIPVLDAQDASVTESGTKFAIPNQYKDGASYTGNYTSEYSHANATISKVGVSGVDEFLSDHLRGLSINYSINREAITYVGYKLNAERAPNSVMKAELSFDTIVKEGISGSFTDNMKENEKYNVVIDLKNKTNTTLAKYTFSGAKLDGVDYTVGINESKSANLKFSAYMDFKNQTEGLFLEGLITQAASGESIVYPQF